MESSQPLFTLESFEQVTPTITSPSTVQPDEQKRAFLTHLNKFTSTNGRPVGKPPIMGYKELDLFNLFKEVIANGGYHSVVRNVGTWSKIWKRLSNFDPSITDSSYRLKKNYERYLLDYEYHCYPQHREFSIYSQTQGSLQGAELQAGPRKKKASYKKGNSASPPSSPSHSSSDVDNDPEYLCPNTASKTRGHKRTRSDSDLSSNNGSSEEEVEEQQKPRQRPKLQTFNTYTISLQEKDEMDIESAVLLLQSLKHCNNTHACVIEAVC